MRASVIRTIDGLRATLEEGVLKAQIETDRHEVVLEYLEEVIETAHLLNRELLTPEQRLTVETSPALKLVLAQRQDPLPREVLTELRDDELAPSEVRQAAFALLHPGQVAVGE